MSLGPKNKLSEPDRNDQLPPGMLDIEIARSVAPQLILLLAPYFLRPILLTRC